jgi:hypothetical protein
MIERAESDAAGFRPLSFKRRISSEERGAAGKVYDLYTPWASPR